MADFFTLNSYVECERTILAKSDREPGGAGIRRGQHARRGARGKIRVRRGVSQRNGRAVSDDRAAHDHAKGKIYALVGRGLSEISADRRWPQSACTGFASGKFAQIQRGVAHRSGRAYFL